MTATTIKNSLIRFGHALSDPVRIEILTALMNHPASPSELADLTGYSRQVISNHLACLRGCELVAVDKTGIYATYELANPRLKQTLCGLCELAETFNPDCTCQHSRKECC
jgi:ArsR family transcriptional regulator, cadmium/lead-responsive transcriptional repressor